MKVVLHTPDTKEATQELSKKVAAVHAQTVLEQIKATPCPAEQKTKLFDVIKQLRKKEDGL